MVCGVGSLCAQHHALVSFILYGATKRTRETKQNRSKNRDFHVHTLIFAWSLPNVQLKFSSEPSHILLCATILDIVSTSCAYSVAPARALAAQTCSVRMRASCSISLNILTAREPMGPGPSSSYFWRLLN